MNQATKMSLLDDSTTIPQSSPVQYAHTCTFPKSFNAYYLVTSMSARIVKIDCGMRKFVSNYEKRNRPDLVSEIDTIVELVYNYHRHLHRMVVVDLILIQIDLK
jgi:hypothetical protein